MKRRAFMFALLLALGVAACSGMAQSWGDFRCHVCGAIGGWIQPVKIPLAPKPKMVCRNCLLTVPRCSICRMPEKEDKLRALDDSRLFCQDDFAAGVFSEQRVDEMLFRTRTELTRVFWRHLSFPETNVTISLVNAREMHRLARGALPYASGMAVKGLTRSEVLRRPGQPERYRHQIHVLSGLPPARFMAVVAHELGHAWMRENVPPQRKIDPHTVEAFCELVAYQLMDSLGEGFEKSVIEANLYTRGHIHILVAAQRRHGFYQVMEWMKHGVDALLTVEELDRIRLIEPPPEPVLPMPVHAAPAPAQASALSLRAIIQSPSEPLALINNQSFAPGERAVISIGDRRLAIECVEIRANSVLVEIDGAERLELFLPGEI